MKRSPKYFHTTPLMLLLFFFSGLFVAVATPSISQDLPEKESYKGSGILDGMIFVGKLGPAGKPADVSDSFVFRDGMFVSIECEKNCNYPARPYFTRYVDNTIEFISETRCPDKDAKIVWRGTIEDGEINGVFTWTISRWYWTVVKDFVFSGKLAPGNKGIAAKHR